MNDRRPQAILLPGGVLPADLAYTGLVGAVGDRAELVPKDLAVYSGDEPPPGYGLDVEIDDVLAAADRAGFERFHLLGYSGGGAAALAMAARRPERLLSLALSEPAWAGDWDMGPGELALRERFNDLMWSERSDQEKMTEFVAMQLRPGIEPPPRPDPPPEWMAKRPAGLAALTAAFGAEEIDPDRLRAFDRPVYLAIGSLSNPEIWEPMAARLAAVFPHFRLETWQDRHHFDPPHRAEPDRFAAALLSHWS